MGDYSKTARASVIEEMKARGRWVLPGSQFLVVSGNIGKGFSGVYISLFLGGLVVEGLTCLLNGGGGRESSFMYIFGG
jgi:hypothetical protein